MHHVNRLRPLTNGNLKSNERSFNSQEQSMDMANGDPPLRHIYERSLMVKSDDPIKSYVSPANKQAESTRNIL